MLIFFHLHCNACVIWLRLRCHDIYRAGCMWGRTTAQGISIYRCCKVGSFCDLTYTYFCVFTCKKIVLYRAALPIGMLKTCDDAVLFYPSNGRQSPPRFGMAACSKQQAIAPSAASGPCTEMEDCEKKTEVSASSRLCCNIMTPRSTYVYRMHESLPYQVHHY